MANSLFLRKQRIFLPEQGIRLAGQGTCRPEGRRAKPHAFRTGADLVEASAGSIPIVSAVDGEVGLLDNLGSIVGVRQEALGLRKASKCGRPSDVYALHHIDADGIVEAALQVLGESAWTDVVVSKGLLVAGTQPLRIAHAPPDAWGGEKSA